MNREEHKKARLLLWVKENADRLRGLRFDYDARPEDLQRLLRIAVQLRSARIGIGNEDVKTQVIPKLREAIRQARIEGVVV